MTEHSLPARGAGLTVLECRTRFLLPFFFDGTGQFGEARRIDAAVRGLTSEGAPWECQTEPSSAYVGDYLPAVADFLFRGGGAADCCALRVPDSVAHDWFAGLRVMPDAAPGVEVPVALVSGSGIELFLSPFGVGVLSLSVRLEGPLDERIVREFHYRASAAHERLRLVRPRREGGARRGASPAERGSGFQPERIADEDSGWKPEPRSSHGARGLPDRLRAEGAEFSLHELADELLAPLRTVRVDGAAPVGFDRAAPGFLTHAVVRLGSAVSWERPEERRATLALLSALAQGLPPSHPGEVEDEWPCESVVLNRRHLLAVALPGAAHAVADQESGSATGFDEQRPDRAHRAYFVGFLLALVQRLTLQRFAAEAAVLLRETRDAADDDEAPDPFRRLRERVLRFALTGDFVHVSSRGVLHRAYQAAQAAADVPRGMKLIRTAIDAQTEAHEAHQLQENIEKLAEIQGKVEWVEVFILAVYYAELGHLFKETFHFAPGPVQGVWSLGLATAGLLGALALVRPWGRKFEWSWSRFAVAFGMLAVLGLYVGDGLFGWLSQRFAGGSH